MLAALFECAEDLDAELVVWWCSRRMNAGPDQLSSALPLNSSSAPTTWANTWSVALLNRAPKPPTTPSSGGHSGRRPLPQRSRVGGDLERPQGVGASTP